MVLAAIATFTLVLLTASADDNLRSLRGPQNETKDAGVDAFSTYAEATNADTAVRNASSTDSYARFVEAVQMTMTTDERDAVLFDALVALGSQAESLSGDACNSGLLGMAVRKYPSATTCLAPCHSSCSAVNAIMGGYMTQGGQPGAIRAACRRGSELTCLFNHIGPCMEFVNRARGLGLTIPTSQTQLDSMCR